MEMDLGVLVNKFSMNEQCAAEAKQDHGMLGSINKDTTSRDKEVIVILYSVLVKPHLEYCVWFGPHYAIRCGQDGQCLEKGHMCHVRKG